MDSFGTSAKESLKTNLRAKLNCNPPACLLEITLSSASVKVGVKVTIPRCRTAPSQRPLGCSRWSTLVYLRNTHVASMSLTMRHIPPCACSSGTGAATNAASITSNVQSVANAIADSPASVSADLGVMVVSASAPIVESNQQISILVPTQAGGGSSGLIIGAIGGVVGSIAVLGIITFVYRRRKKSGSFSTCFPELQPAQASRASKSSSSTQPTLIEANEILKRKLGLEGSISSVVEQAAAHTGRQPGTSGGAPAEAGDAGDADAAGTASTTPPSKSNLRWRKVQEDVVTQPSNLELWPSMKELDFATKSGPNAQRFFQRIAAMTASKSTEV